MRNPVLNVHENESDVTLGPWVMRQRWHDLLFAHWPMPAEAMRHLIPAPLSIDVRDGSAWIGVVPFRMTGVRFRGVPPIPTAHQFAELNVRTYVSYQGRPGVWFFSLDAASSLAVVGARLGAALPYFKAAIAMTRSGSWLQYRSDRAPGRGGYPAAFDGRYELRHEGERAKDGSLEHFLTERYCLYSGNTERLWRVDIAHAPWQLTPTRCELHVNTMIAAAGLPGPRSSPLLHHGADQDVRFWWPKRVF